MSGNVFVVTNVGVEGGMELPSMQWVEGGDAAKRPTVHRTASCPQPPASNKDLSGPKCQERCCGDSLLSQEAEVISHRIFPRHSNWFLGPFKTLLFHDLHACYSCCGPQTSSISTTSEPPRDAEPHAPQRTTEPEMCISPRTSGDSYTLYSLRSVVEASLSPLLQSFPTGLFVLLLLTQH